MISIASVGDERLVAAVLVVAVYLAFCGAIALRARRQRRTRAATVSGGTAGGMPTLVVFASQTGFAEKLAWRTAEALQAAGAPTRVMAMDEVDADRLAATERALFLVSTTGEGDAPDGALGFVRQVMSRPAPLARLRYGLLALGDRSYDRFCGFGRMLDDWLDRQQAQPLFARIEVDNADTAALDAWRRRLGEIAGTMAALASAPEPYGRWRLVERVHLNPGSPGDPAFHVALAPVDGDADWQPGDIVEIEPRNAPADVATFLHAVEQPADAEVSYPGEAMPIAKAVARAHLPPDPETRRALRGQPAQVVADALRPLAHRDYSIASLAASGRIELLVRRHIHPDGSLGLASGWLTEWAPIGAEVGARIRTNASFHPPPPDRPMILVGNGTGLAGLLCHLRARAAAGSGRNWLLHGERTRSHDLHHREELGALDDAGHLVRLDLAFSRDPPARVLVQHLVAAHAEEIRRWVADGAAIYVCGSLRGMAPGVHAALTEALGADAMDRLIEQRRYRRDVY